MEPAYIAFKNFRGDVGYDFDLGGIGYKIRELAQVYAICLEGLFV